MTDKQKKALKILNELWYVSRNDGLANLSDENYYLLLEFVVGNSKPQITYIPFTQTDPQPLDPVYGKVETILTRKEEQQ